jgi:hypothetical protein
MIKDEKVRVIHVKKKDKDMHSPGIRIVAFLLLKAFGFTNELVVCKGKRVQKLRRQIPSLF